MKKNHYASGYDPKKTSAKHEYPSSRYSVPQPYVPSRNYDLIVDDYYESQDILKFCKENKMKVINWEACTFIEDRGGDGDYGSLYHLKPKMVIQLARGKDYTFLALKYGLTD